MIQTGALDRPDRETEGKKVRKPLSPKDLKPNKLQNDRQGREHKQFRLYIRNLLRVYFRRVALTQEQPHNVELWRKFSSD